MSRAQIIAVSASAETVLAMRHGRRQRTSVPALVNLNQIKEVIAARSHCTAPARNAFVEPCRISIARVGKALLPRVTAHG